MKNATFPARLPSAHHPGGRLFVVGTPIGNLEDITLRALNTLKTADLIACEDTRRTQKLLNHYNIRTRTVSYHEHNEMTRAPELVLEMEQGSSIALVSDAGTPVLSDPGFRLVHLAIRHKIQVVPVPGPSAMVAALAVAALPMNEFIFTGFFPAKRSARRKALGALAGFEKTIVFYEAPHRIVECLRDVHEILGERELVIAREVTKLHEQFLRGSITELLAFLKKTPARGELTVIVGPGAAPEAGGGDGASLREEIERLKASEGLDERAALKSIARGRGISRSEAYRQLQLEKSTEKEPS
ncbi:MAG: 16S rRNA (cytidine(1402)-2'-O)-methyltransferase [Acidobacteria bacterium]|nr:MAG: 16S rRNA (cytidine(1402)-2'-O)-methyltransferase [Acidobacteriota bacterium]